MRLVRLDIERLYGHYDYSVDFNQDITFLYGGNGSGKTTILNIITYIIRGEIYKLFKYDFNLIELSYLEKNQEKTIGIRRKEIGYKDKDGPELKKGFYKHSGLIEFNYLEDSYLIKEDEILSLLNLYDDYDFKIRLFNMYPVLEEIAHSFNYIYLPLGRKSMDINVDSGYFLNSDLGRKKDDSEEDSLYTVEKMVEDEINRINKQQTKIMDRFRDQVLKNMTGLNFSYMHMDVKEYLNKGKKDDEAIKMIGDNYLYILGKLDIYGSRERKEMEEHFEKTIEMTSMLNKGSLPENERWKLAISYSELNRIEKIVKLSEEMESEKEVLNWRLVKYLDTINDFLSITNEKKYARIRNNSLCFYIPETESYIGLDKLSSGEKQIVIFFANLILNLKEESSGIFIVDEPEISLHLAWQNIFVDKILEVSKDIQLIFATHSPEIIGRRHDKVCKLDKKIHV